MSLQVFVTKLNFPSFSVGSMWMIKSTDKHQLRSCCATFAVYSAAIELKIFLTKPVFIRIWKSAKVIWKCLTMSIYFQTKSLQWTKSLVNHHTHKNHSWIFTRIKITRESSHPSKSLVNHHIIIMTSKLNIS